MKRSALLAVLAALAAACDDAPAPGPDGPASDGGLAADRGAARDGAPAPDGPAADGPADLAPGGDGCTPLPGCAGGTSFRCAPVTQGMRNPDPPIVCGCFPDSCPPDQSLIVSAALGSWCDGSSQGSASCSSQLPP